MRCIFYCAETGQVGGTSLFLPWISEWVLDLAVEKNAIIVMPDYRLLPESTGSDVLDDMDDFWTWLTNGGIHDTLRNNGIDQVTVDVTKTLLEGESAGELAPPRQRGT